VLVQSECKVLSTLERVAAVWIVSLEEKTCTSSSFESESRPTMVSALGELRGAGSLFATRRAPDGRLECDRWRRWC
jgi:hypothetical protein